MILKCVTLNDLEIPFYTGWTKKLSLQLLLISSQYVELLTDFQFFFHWHIPGKLFNNVVIKYPTTR